MKRSPKARIQIEVVRLRRVLRDHVSPRVARIIESRLRSDETRVAKMAAQAALEVDEVDEVTRAEVRRLRRKLG